jgi:DNA-binding transcriptional ArsR family regulator
VAEQSVKAATKRTARPRDRAGAVDASLVKALGHPLRQRILAALAGRVASPKQIATELEERLGNVSYHVHVLADADAIELVRTAKVRGATEHFYRATKRPLLTEEEFARLPPSARTALGSSTLRQIFEHAAAAGEAGAFEDPKVHVSWTKLELDEEALDELGAELEAIVVRALELHTETAERAAKDPDPKPHRTELAILHYERA